jgi:hypothetical protein
MRVCLAKAARTSCSRVFVIGADCPTAVQDQIGVIDGGVGRTIPATIGGDDLHSVRPVSVFLAVHQAHYHGACIRPFVAGALLGQDAAQVVQDFSVGAFDEAVLFVSRRSFGRNRSPVKREYMLQSRVGVLGAIVRAYGVRYKKKRSVS